MWNSIKSLGVMLGFIAFLGLGLWQTCFKTTNEIGPLGADKAGRQIFIQTLDYYIDQETDSITVGYAVDIDSEARHVPLWRRVLQEPMRTTFLLSYRVKDHSKSIDTEFSSRFLQTSADEIIDLYQGPISLRDEWEVSPDSLRARFHSLGGATMADFLSGLGFRTFEVRIDDKIITKEALPRLGRENVKHVGG